MMETVQAGEIASSALRRRRGSRQPHVVVLQRERSDVLSGRREDRVEHGRSGHEGNPAILTSTILQRWL
jgi:hypothetical protein